MSAVPNTNSGDGSSRAEVFVAKMQQQYTNELDAARMAEKTTQTDGWRNAYADQLKTHRATCDELAKRLAAIAQDVRNLGSSEDVEKALGEIKTALKDERIRHEAWYARAVAQFAEPAKECSRIRADILANAQAHERQNTLTANGLSSEVASLIEKWPRPVWKDQEGVMVIE
jgi:hypothetical protein